MPTPREAAQKHNPGSGEGSYCGVCGTPGSMCSCKQYKEYGANATKAGSESVDDKSPPKGENGDKKAPPFGGKPPFMKEGD